MNELIDALRKILMYQDSEKRNICHDAADAIERLMADIKWKDAVIRNITGHLHLGEDGGMSNIQNACALLINELYITEPVGGDIHIVTDDINVSDEDLAWCEYFIKKQEKEHKPIGKLELAILWLLAMMSEDDRLKCIKKGLWEDGSN